MRDENRHGLLRVGRRQRRRRHRAGARARAARPPGAPHQQRAAVPVAGRRRRACRSSRVDVPPYPLFREPQYLLALANTIARVAEERRLDIVHAHYAVPHATAAYLAYQMLAASHAPAPTAAPRTVTTLHGTDITLVGSDPSYARVVAFSIERSHGVTAVSESLKARHDRRARHPARDPRHPQLPRLRRVSPPARSGRCARGCARPSDATRWSCTSRTSGRSSASTWRSRSSA